MTFARIYLSPPHMSGHEQAFIQSAFSTNWIAPVGPNINAFEEEFCTYTGTDYALATSSGTAAIHLALCHLKVQDGDEVFVSTLTFSASVNPIIYCGGTPVFIDSELTSWNMDPNLLEVALKDRAQGGKLPKAVIVVHIYGQTADMDAICAVCEQYGVPVIEDAAEACGSIYKGKHAGTLGHAGILSFNGNKIITTSGGGMLFSYDKTMIDHARKLATQAREQTPHYQHTEIGYNYRLSNILAGIGRGQLGVIEKRVQKRRETFAFYQETLGHLAGIQFMPEAAWGRTNRWLSVILVDEKLFGASREDIRLHLESKNIESRPVWKPMHLQPIFARYDAYGGHVSEQLFKQGLCLPSGSNLSLNDLERITTHIKALYKVTKAPSSSPHPIQVSNALSTEV